MQPVNDLDSRSGSGSVSVSGSVVVGTLAQLWRFPVKSMAGEGTLSALSLDGLVSVWHPSEN